MGLNPEHVAAAQRPGEQFGEVTRLIEAVNRRKHQFDRPLGGKALSLERIGQAKPANGEVGPVGTDPVKLALDILAFADARFRRQRGQIVGQMRAVKIRCADFDRDHPQFGAQEPGPATEIESFCQVNYGVSFPMFSKIDVNGSEAHPLYQFLKGEKPGLLGTEAIKWNFTKFLVNREGQVIKRYAPTDTPEKIKSDIQKLI